MPAPRPGSPRLATAGPPGPATPDPGRLGRCSHDRRPVATPTDPGPAGRRPQDRRPVLVAVAHGSRDPRSAATVADLVDVVRGLRPWLDVRPAFLDLSLPRLGDVLAALNGPAVVVPLLLGNAHHARVDLPAAVHAAVRVSGRRPLDARIAGVLGPDPRLGGVALRRLAEAGVALDNPGLGVVLAAAGSSHRAANDAVAAVAASLARGAPWVGAAPAFAAGDGPSVADAVATLRSRGARRIAVASWFLAPGRLPDRVTDAAHAHGAVPAAPLGAAPELAQVVLDRYDRTAREWRLVSRHQTPLTRTR